MIPFEAGGVVALVLLGFWIWALFDCISTDSSLCRNLPKGVWLVVVLLLPDLGSLAWLLLGRPENAHWRPGSTGYAAPRRSVGFEDDPRYSPSAGVTDRKSAELDAELARWEASRRAEQPEVNAGAAVRPDLDAWEQDLNRREAELRRRELEARQRELDRRERGTGSDED